MIPGKKLFPVSGENIDIGKSAPKKPYFLLSSFQFHTTSRGYRHDFLQSSIFVISIRFHPELPQCRSRGDMADFRRVRERPLFSGRLISGGGQNKSDEGNCVKIVVGRDQNTCRAANQIADFTKYQIAEQYEALLALRPDKCKV